VIVSRTGSMLDEVTAGAILQQVNASNRMGSGLARAIMDRWPVVAREYHRLCNRQAPALPGETWDEAVDRLMGVAQEVEVAPGLWVVNLFGQAECGPDGATYRYTSYDALDVALARAADWARSLGLPLHVPMIGAGLGGGHWPVIRALIAHRLGDLDVTLWRRPQDPAL
jgi:O-acetyl-ADP-ribose deacetylase (regulator of RNase III)